MIIVQNGIASFRATYATPPTQLDVTGFNDALNPDNYEVEGPRPNLVSSVVSVKGDPNSVDVYLTETLTEGDWTLIVVNVEVLPTEASTFVTVSGNQEIISHGAVNDDVCEVLRKLFNPALKGLEWDAVLCALAAGDSINWTNAKLALDQLAIASASGIYLDKRASDVGQRRPPNVGLSDELFRRLTIVENSEKLSQEAVLDILEIFYGKDAVSAEITSDTSEPYRLQDDDDLRILLDEIEDITVIFKREEFARLGEATAKEVAAAITRACINAKSQGFAIPVTDPETGLKKVKIYSAKSGLSSSVRIIGGSAQRVLRFPESIFTVSGVSPFASWDISLSPTTPGNIRFTETSGIYDLQNLIAGDLVYIYGDEFTASGSLGVFEVQEVLVEYTPGLVQWFEIINPFGSADTVSQILFEDLMFFRPVRHTLYDQSRRVIVAQTQPGLNIEIPATTLAVSRSPGTAAYLETPAEYSVSDLFRINDEVTVTTTDPSGLSVGDQFFIDQTEATVEFISSMWVVTPPSTTPGTVSGNFVIDVATGTTDASILTTISEADTFEGVYHRVLRLPEELLMIVGGESQLADVSTTLPNPVIFEITGDTTVNGERQQTYQWTRLSGDTLTVDRRDFGANVLSDGRVLLTGGHNSTNLLVVAPTNSWDIIVYNNTPGDNYMVSGVMPVALGAHGQCEMEDGNVLVSGGWTTAWTDLLTASYVMDPDSYIWTTVASMKDARVQHQLIHIDNRVLAIGGRHSNLNPNATNGTVLNTCEIYSTSGNTWTRTGSMSSARFGFGSVTMPDGRIMVVGGIGYNPTRSQISVTLKSTEIYDPNTGFWTAGPPMAFARDWPTVELIGNSVFVAGGLDVSAVEILNLETMKWSRAAADLVAPSMYRSQGGLAGSDTLVVIGGSIDANSDSTPDTTLKLNNVMVQNQATLLNGGLNTLSTVETVIDPNSFTYKTPEHLGYTFSPTGSVVPFKALASADAAPGPFVFDPIDGVSITSIFSIITMELEQDQHYNILEVADATVFPDEPGYLVFNFGYENSVAPVQYMGRLSGTELALDAGFKFPVTVPVNATVILLRDRLPFIPDQSDEVGSFWATDSASGRIAAQLAIDETVAAGIDVDVKVIYPGSRGLGAEEFPNDGNYKLSDVVSVFGGNDLDLLEIKNIQNQ